MKITDILGLNARTQLYSYPFNKKKAKSKAASKLSTKKALVKAGIPVPLLLAKFSKASDLVGFEWDKLPNAFALKPSKGLGGEGIIVVKKRLAKEGWITTQKTKVTVSDLKLHVLDILEGAYSIGNIPDIAFVEEYVGRHKAFRKYAYRGTPDIRIIVFNKVPVMAMLRLPTKESGGRANLHQGAIAVGIDIATGITVKAYWHGEYIHYKPGTKRKLNGIKIPSWTQILTLASECQITTEIGYLGADVVLHPEKGPMILELNYQPGLSIQLANSAGLKKRLDKVEDLKVRDADHGVKIAKSLFMSNFADRVNAEEGIKIIKSLQEIIIRGAGGKKRKVIAKIDTGAWRTSINENLAQELGLLSEGNILWKKKFKSSLGIEERPVISLIFKMAGRKIITPASVAKRHSLKYPVIIGRKNLKGFLVDAVISPSEIEEMKKK
ncbi:MAG: Alpha-L-glutamate ligase-like protein [Candidatus Woesebacteria bacterium GW2011_GWA1_37_7]|uniref:Alpha-L-glutamate ligase-like protein n=1 Tax=Candidatus Woesebacteria bacterium GW2011_GWA1_37_7 TaxID=1618545 RepID=A0A0G0JJ83_9BACT|nr:MAG: Alpha-L-glutamate ligase-like protein [Candidatus Woesebacteria bacterium GW2011_GWA1_37_7]